jgi:REP element-mobilizing transposase RayT
MSRNYKFHNPEGLYFVGFNVVMCLDVFTCNEYKDIALVNLSYCQKNKGMEIFAWCVMTNHMHLVFRSINGLDPASILGDFKRFTSKAIVNAIINNPKESRKEFLLEQFKKAAQKTSNVNNYQFWRHDNKPIELWSNEVIQEKIQYVHQNPVEAGLVYFPEDYVYSSASDYAEGRAYRKQPVAVFSEGASRRWGVYLSNTPLPRDTIATLNLRFRAAAGGYLDNVVIFEYFGKKR